MTECKNASRLKVARPSTRLVFSNFMVVHAVAMKSETLCVIWNGGRNLHTEFHLGLCIVLQTQLHVQLLVVDT